jgi:hypothetical protein
MNKIFKYPLQITDTQVITSQHLCPLSVQFQGETLCLWGVVSTTAVQREYTVLIIGTGNPAPDDLDEYMFVGTVQDHRGLVWHVFIQ